ncbi:MAG TPA: hypothetical protein VLZ50_10005 [Terracidiphilus sp.]|nr:hypothetical protein [Terracidiphilus sp.]
MKNVWAEARALPADPWIDRASIGPEAPVYWLAVRRRKSGTGLDLADRRGIR